MKEFRTKINGNWAMVLVFILLFNRDQIFSRILGWQNLRWYLSEWKSLNNWININILIPNQNIDSTIITHVNRIFLIWHDMTFVDSIIEKITILFHSIKKNIVILLIRDILLSINRVKGVLIVNTAMDRNWFFPSLFGKMSILG